MIRMPYSVLLVVARTVEATFVLCFVFVVVVVVVVVFNLFINCFVIVSYILWNIYLVPVSPQQTGSFNDLSSLFRDCHNTILNEECRYWCR